MMNHQLNVQGNGKDGPSFGDERAPTFPKKIIFLQ
jgi:hypothetical protein